MNKSDEIKMLAKIKKLYCIKFKYKIEEPIKNTIKNEIAKTIKSSMGKTKKINIAYTDPLVISNYSIVTTELNKKFGITNFSNYESEEGFYIYSSDNSKYDELGSQFALITNDKIQTLKLVNFEPKKFIDIDLNINGKIVKTTFNILQFDVSKTISYKYYSSKIIWAQRNFECNNNLIDQGYTTKNLNVYKLTLEGKSDFTFLTSDYDFGDVKNKRNFYIGDENNLKTSSIKFLNGDIALRLEKSTGGLIIKDFVYYDDAKKEWLPYDPLDEILQKKGRKGLKIEDYLKRKKYPSIIVEETKTSLSNNDIYKYNIGRTMYDLFLGNLKDPEKEENEENEVEQENVATTENKELKKFENFRNVIFYGVPGCGKSYEVKKLLKGNEKRVSRVLFHPEYTYSDFVGQLLPNDVDNSKNFYKFSAGPFCKILKRAILDNENNYYLIIEEINRGNAPEIFGDIFQLLDRNDEGESEYHITNDQILKFLQGTSDLPKEEQNILNELKYYNKLNDVYLPSNLYIFATMNTCDQNVFSLDTAFKRRWRMYRIKNDFLNKERNKERSKEQIADIKIDNEKLTWGAFAEAVNSIIVEGNEGLEEDKQLGVWFVNKYELNDKSAFAEKVLMYLWNDVFKYNRNKIFNTEKFKTLDAVIDKFSNSNEDKSLDVFNEDVIEKMKSSLNNFM